MFRAEKKVIGNFRQRRLSVGLKRRCIATALAAGLLGWMSTAAEAHGTLVNGRMYQVRVAGPNGHAPAAWNDSYYTWNQDSNNFPNYANPSFTYSSAVPNGTIASAGINDGTGTNGHTTLNFTGLDTPSAGWTPTPATAGKSLALHWVASAPHDPSFFEVFLTKQGFDPTQQTLNWANLEDLGRWAIGDATRPVTNATAISPAGGSSLSYDWNVPIPADRSGREALVVVWQRVDPAGEAFFAVQDLQVAVPEPVGGALFGVIGIALTVRRRRRGMPRG